MIVGFSKLFADIIHSTVWREPMHVKVVWITMLAMADRHGQVFASLPGLADSAKVTLEECIEALEIFSSPDKYSRTKDYEGRRIVEIDGGWLLLNYEKFRERRDDEEQRIKTRDRVRRCREKAKALGNDVTEVVTATESNDITEAEAEANTEAECFNIAKNSLNFEPSPTDLAWHDKNCPLVDWSLETQQWADYHLSKGTKIKNKAASWRTWMRNAQKWTSEKNKGATNARQERTDNAINEHSLIEGIRERVTNRQLQRVNAIGGK